MEPLEIKITPYLTPPGPIKHPMTFPANQERRMYNGKTFIIEAPIAPRDPEFTRVQSEICEALVIADIYGDFAIKYSSFPDGKRRIECDPRIK